jgi:hypothetical protein
MFIVTKRLKEAIEFEPFNEHPTSDLENRWNNGNLWGSANVDSFFVLGGASSSRVKPCRATTLRSIWMINGVVRHDATNKPHGDIAIVPHGIPVDRHHMSPYFDEDT